LTSINQNQFEYRNSVDSLIRVINKLYPITTNTYRQGADINYMIDDD